MDKIPSILEAKANSYHKELLLDLMCNGSSNDTSDLRDCVEYILDEKTYLFESKEFEGYLYDGEDEILTIILPLVRRVWNRIYTHPPSSLSDDKINLLKNYFDIDHFLNYLKDILPKSKGLEVFNFIDKTNEICEIVVDNYIFMIIYEISHKDKKELGNHILKMKRDKSLKNILK